MSEEAHGRGESPDPERLRQALAALPAPEADPVFRERLRDAFVSGVIAERAGTRARAVRERGRFSFPRLWIPVAAAAAVAATLAIGLLNQGPRWRVDSVRGTGVARIDGRTVRLSDREALARRIRPGVSVRLPEGAELNLVAERSIAMLVTPGTDMTVPSAPPRWFGRHTDVTVRHGIVRFTTGREFHGARLTVHTPEAMVEVTGTTFTVIRDPEIGTCVCVYEGLVRVGTREGRDMVDVPGGMRRIFYVDARPPEVREIRKDERVYLREYREEMAPEMK
jgi:ferric-dicitrate binding protein FerR (iron transport regulator)